MIYKLYKYLKHYLAHQEQKNNLKLIGEIGRNVTIRNNFKVIGGKYVVLGNDVYIGPDSRIEAWDSYLADKFHPQIILCDGVRINSKVHIGAIDKVYIGEGCLLGSNVFITDHAHGHSNFQDMNIPPTERRLISKGGGKNRKELLDL